MTLIYYHKTQHIRVGVSIKIFKRNSLVWVVDNAHKYLWVVAILVLQPRPRVKLFRNRNVGKRYLHGRYLL